MVCLDSRPLSLLTIDRGLMLSNPSLPLHLTDLPTITNHTITWARQAGEIAMRYFKHVLPDYKPDQTMLTRADVEIEQFLRAQIRLTYPDHGVIGEEELTDPASLTASYIWVIDALDGTTTYVRGLPGWGISLGLLYAGQPVFGLFYMPLLDDLTYTTVGGIQCGKEFLRQCIQPDWRHKGFLAVSSSAHHDFQIDVSRIRALGSVGASLVYTARGSATAALIPKAYLWDLAAGAIILTQAGGELRYLSGQPVDYVSLLDGRLAPEPLIAGHPNILAELAAAIRPRLIE